MQKYILHNVLSTSSLPITTPVGFSCYRFHSDPDVSSRRSFYSNSCKVCRVITERYGSLTFERIQLGSSRCHCLNGLFIMFALLEIVFTLFSNGTDVPFQMVQTKAPSKSIYLEKFSILAILVNGL